MPETSTENVPEPTTQPASPEQPSKRSIIKTLAASRWAFLLYGLLVATLVILGIRFVTYSAPYTHFHANFAMYINGEQEKFNAPQYYEEVSICGMKGTVTPKMRTHMHNSENGVVHVHDEGVTWGQFFENLGWYIGPDFVRTPSRIYVADDVNKLHIMLNGQDLTGLSTITNELIGDKDRLLVSFGDVSDDQMSKEYSTVLSNAGEYNSRPDPASCAGDHNATLSERFKHLF